MPKPAGRGDGVFRETAFERSNLPLSSKMMFDMDKGMIVDSTV
jgi:hypothetical protein